MKQGALYLFLATSSLGVYGQSTSAKGSVELMGGLESSTLDTKVLKNISKKIAFFNRNRITSNAKGNISTFHIAKLGYKVIDNLGITAGMMGTSKGGISPQVGLEYFFKKGDFKFYQLALSSLKKDPTIMSLTNVSYSPELKKNLGLVAEFENVSFFNKEGNLVSLQRPRLGVKYKGFQAGVAVDFSENGKKGKLNYNPGFFLRATF